MGLLTPVDIAVRVRWVSSVGFFFSLPPLAAPAALQSLYLPTPLNISWRVTQAGGRGVVNVMQRASLPPGWV